MIFLKNNNMTYFHTALQYGKAINPQLVKSVKFVDRQIEQQITTKSKTNP